MVNVETHTTKYELVFPSGVRGEDLIRCFEQLMQRKFKECVPFIVENSETYELGVDFNVGDGFTFTDPNSGQELPHSGWVRFNLTLSGSTGNLLVTPDFVFYNLELVSDPWQAQPLRDFVVTLRKQLRRFRELLHQQFGQPV